MLDIYKSGVTYTFLFTIRNIKTILFYPPPGLFLGLPGIFWLFLHGSGIFRENYFEK